MNEQQTASPSLSSWRSLFQLQDLAWAIFVAILLIAEPEVNNNARILVPLIGVFQIIEPRLKLFRSKRGQIVSIGLKLILCYLLIGYTHSLNSYYSPIFLVPIVSAATIFDLPGVLVVAALATLGIFSFLLPAFVNWSDLPPEIVNDLSLRAAFYAAVGFLVYQQASAKRKEIARTEEALANLRLAEVSLRRSERLAALGQLTAGLAHELRNPLGTIKASAEMLTRHVAQSQPEIMAEMAGYISSEIDRINGLIASFLDFARPLRMKAALNELNPLLEEIVRQQNESASQRDVRITIDNGDPNLRFAFDPELLRVALSNLVQNAVEASSSGGVVEIRVVPGDDFVMLLVADHGEGIQPQHLESIFNPFFTTKSNGVGLGLALVSKIVDEHGGKIKVFSEPGKGTTFEVLLPTQQLL
ncbi:MAG TPA: ATP-binding protein [Bryobacteraceae bacterium]|jgi:signal transduction histidine kinase|nr:ATP-binding protein [Bryobacteraceae bacterium]